MPFAIDIEILFLFPLQPFSLCISVNVKSVKMMTRVVAAVAAIFVAAVMPHFHKSFNAYMMGFFRDISRVKARKRRMQKDAVISVHDIKGILFHDEDDPLKDVADEIVNGDGIIDNDIDTEKLPTYTREELYELGNGDDGVLLISVFGRVYDVSSGEKFYGADGKYGLFAGRDVTRALSTGCLQPKCLGHKTNQGDERIDNFELNDKSIKEGKKWVAFFETHDTYKHVGFLKDGTSIEHLIDALVEEETASLCKKEKMKVAY